MDQTPDPKPYGKEAPKKSKNQNDKTKPCIPHIIVHYWQSNTLNPKYHLPYLDFHVPTPRPKKQRQRNEFGFFSLKGFSNYGLYSGPLGFRA